MTFRIVDTDNVRESFSSLGTTITLGGAVPNSRSISSIAGIVTGDTFFAVARKSGEISIGEFTWTSSGGTVAQTDVWYSSNSNNAVSFSAGPGEIFLDGPSRLFDELNLKEITVASAATCDIGAAQGGKILISGTVTITSFGTTKNKRRLVRSSGALTLTHNATSLILPGGINIAVAAGDTFWAASDSSGNWRVYDFERGNGHPLTTGNATIASATTTDLGSVLAETITVSGTTTITGFGSTAPTGATKFVKFSGALLLTHNATSLILPGAANITTVAGDCLITVHEGSGNWRVLSYVRASGMPAVQGLAASFAVVTSTAALTYGGVTLSNSVLGTGSMVLGSKGTWTPVLNGFTNVGTPTVSGTYTRNADGVHVNFTLTPATSIATTAGTSYVSGPPFALGISSVGVTAGANAGPTRNGVNLFNNTGFWIQTFSASSEVIYGSANHSV